MTRTAIWGSLLAIGAILAGPAAGARAGLLPTSVTVTPESGNFRWTYAIVLPTDSQLQAGNFFTIYDFAGYVPGSESAPAGWTLTTQLVGTTPTTILPTDNPALWNLTWTYTGSTISGGQLGLGNFWAYSEYDLSTDANFVAQTMRTSDGKLDTNITDTSVPVPSGTPVVPEPTTLALAGLGLPLLGLGRALRRRAGK